MSVPFTPEQFFGAFAQYNVAVWPVQYVMLVLGLTAMVLLLANMRSMVIAIPVLAFLWLWTGMVYFGAFFSAVTPAAYVFATAFIIEALLLLHWSVSGASIRVPPAIERTMAIILFAYVFVGYPLVGFAAGHRYPASVSFGLPCPTVIFTFAVFSLLAPSIPPRLFIVPVLWAITGTVAAMQLHVPQDLGMPVAGAAALLLALQARLVAGKERSHGLHAV
jgi:hypothetical protein